MESGPTSLKAVLRLVALVVAFRPFGLVRSFQVPIKQRITRTNPKVFPNTWCHIQQNQKRAATRLRAFDAEGAMGGAAELTSALSRIDKAWKIQQRSKPRSRWTKLILNSNDEVEEPVEEENMADVSMGNDRSGSEDFVYLLEPPNFMNPSCLIVFTGGAGLGTFPQVAYQQFLERISDRMNAAVITAPYPVGLDHFQLAKKVGERQRKAILQCEEDPQRLYSPNLPIYCLAHSLGCKLASIYAAATGQEYDGTGFISFNNFSFGSTIGMAKEFAQTLQEEYGASGRMGVGTPSSGTLNDIFDLAQGFLGNIGLEFTPSPEDTERLISMKFDEERFAKTRLFVLDDDNLDDSESFLRAYGGRQSDLALSALPGDHLTPVYFKLDLNDIPEEARELARENLNGFESASFGNAENLDALVEEVCGFLLGKEPARRPTRPLLSGSEDDSSS